MTAQMFKAELDEHREYMMETLTRTQICRLFKYIHHNSDCKAIYRQIAYERCTCGLSKVQDELGFQS